MVRLRRNRDRHVAAWLAAFLTVAALFWVLVLLAAPAALARGGSTAAALIFEIGARICHQRAERSFHIAGVQMPVCARCLGLYASGALGALIAWGAAARRSVVLLHDRARLMLFVAAAPTVISVAAEWLDVAHPSNTWRAFLAVPLGAVAGWMFVRSLRAHAHGSRPVAEMRYHF